MRPVRHTRAIRLRAIVVASWDACSGTPRSRRQRRERREPEERSGLRRPGGAAAAEPVVEPLGSGVASFERQFGGRSVSNRCRGSSADPRSELTQGIGMGSRSRPPLGEVALRPEKPVRRTSRRPSSGLGPSLDSCLPKEITPEDMSDKIGVLKWH